MAHKPEYSKSLAYMMSVASKLSYEDIQVIAYELDKGGFDMKSSFKPFAFKNVCAYSVDKDDITLLVFRGSNPLNVQNYLTNLDIRLADVYAARGYLGKVHKGYWEALGGPDCEMSSRTTLTLSKMSRWKEWARQLVDPVDYRFLSTLDRDLQRNHSLYSQIETHLLDRMKLFPNKRLFVTGHSLGAALATMFAAKLAQHNSLLLQNLGGVYTFGQPKLCDERFSRVVFDRKLTNVFTRLPSYSEYSTPPGTLVFIDSAYNIHFFPPDQYTNEPVPVPLISYLHSSGLLDAHVVSRLPKESLIRIVYRLLAPYMINDHFASEYPNCLKNGNIVK
ncbi:alpha/beta-hydrolase [Hesseltinella vesiculosa]|uniref:Alpha/beta-hydrolase n=1 Tax=Hesseltinella vesiculosa TaxID=101127 RepID=A0A1X2GLJ5_9FUNG|nr:alpha/beta-hydrolase [Hesseltinella vesiculosa]